MSAEQMYFDTTWKFEDGLYRFGHTRVQPIGLVRGHPNLIARIMAYDEDIQAGGVNDSLAARHKQILEGVTSGGIHQLSTPARSNSA